MVLTDNGKEVTDRFCAIGERQPTGAHALDQVCAANYIEHRLIKPRTPQTSGMIERFNGRIADVLATTRVDSSEHLATTIQRYVQVYNQHIPQKAVGHIQPLRVARARHGCRARCLSSSMGTLRLVHPLKPLRLANRRGMTDTLKTTLMDACFAHPTGFA